MDARCTLGPMDIDACAAANGPTWARRADELEAGDPRVSPFRAVCRDAGLGMNVTASKLLHFVTCDQIVPTFAYRTALEDETAAERLVYESDDVGRGRLAFETALGSARTALYGTLDLDNTVGDDQYGPFRLVVEQMDGKPEPIVLPHNSAIWYAPNGDLDESGVCTDAARWEHRADVATVARSEQALASSPAAWPAILSGPDPSSPVEHDAMEVVLRDGSRPMSSVATIRMSQHDRDSLDEEYARGLVKGEDEHGEHLIAYGELMMRVDSGALPLEVL